MKTVFYRSLDRPVDIFGLRGSWISVFLYTLGALLVLAFLVGAFTTVGIGFSVIIIGGIAAFFVYLVLQSKVPSRQIDKVKVSSKLRRAVIRRETISRIILDDPWKGKGNV